MSEVKKSSKWATDKINVLNTNGSLMKVESIAEYSPWSMLQYFWPALSKNRYWKPNFGLLFEWPLKTGLLYLIAKYDIRSKAEVGTMKLI